jgi:hypothetical protein
MVYDIEKAASELIALARSENTSGAIAAALLSEHEHCFKCENVCDLCTYIDEDSLDSFLGAFASNPSLSSELQNMVLGYAFDWQGREYQVLRAFAENTNVSDEVKKSTLDVFVITENSEAEYDIPSYLEAFRENPRYTKDEINSFIKDANETYELPEDWDK